MAEIAVSVATTAVSSVTENVARTVGGIIGSGTLQSDVNKIFGSTEKFVNKEIRNLIKGTGQPKVSGRRLSDLAVQSSAYGKPIASVYGSARIAGNIIWAQPLKERLINSGDGGGKGGVVGVSSAGNKHYEYSVTLAIGLCEGEIDGIERVWADSKVIDPSQFTSSYRLYTGSEDQLADPTIESFQELGNAPAYRGLSYVVIEDFPLADYGNRIPNFSFEVRRKLKPIDIDGLAVEDMITGVNIIPGSGEFVYDTVVQSKVVGDEVDGALIATDVKTRINQTNNDNKANALVALDALEETVPNIEWTGLVCSWFGDNLDAGLCNIRPGVEFNAGADTEPDQWSVAGYNRSNAYLISTDDQGSPVYGGTPTDISILRYIDELKSRGLKVMFYPLFFMDTPSKPWRGRVTGGLSDVTFFFTKSGGYNDYILHYANLVKDKVDAFVIGSELIGLTSVTDAAGSFPAVDELVALAAQVKAIVGSNVTVTYAADWSEYHHTAGGWYNLDPLWASPNIDVVGIDAYFALTDRPQVDYDVQEVKDGWNSGEDFDFYYTDPERTATAPLSPEYALKNIDYWWNNTHTNPDANDTPWVAASKPIWFTEYGFPSVDGASNQPNVFYDPSSSESFFPRFSKGRVDNRAQRAAIAATESFWKDSSIVQQKFVWTWDARPFPFWPDLTTIWSDGGLWKTGHWLQGKLGVSGVGAIVSDLCVRSGLSVNQIDISQLNGLVDGYVLDEQFTAKQAIELLQSSYFFDVFESDGVVKFVSRGQQVAQTISSNELIGNLATKRSTETELPARIDVSFLNRSRAYQIGNQYAQRLVTESEEKNTLSLPVVMGGSDAKYIAEVSLYNAWTERVTYTFSLPPSFHRLEPADVLRINDVSSHYVMRIQRSIYTNGKGVQIDAVAENKSIYDFYSHTEDLQEQIPIVGAIGLTQMEILDLPALPGAGENDCALRFALAGQEERWHGAVIYRSDDSGVNYSPIAQSSQPAIFGTVAGQLENGTVTQFDVENNVEVITNGELESVTDAALLNGANISLLGDEIVQFGEAELISQNRYRLSRLLRGRSGTEYATAQHLVGERFVMINNQLVKGADASALIGLSRDYKSVSVGGTLDTADNVKVIVGGRSLQPYAPVHVTGRRNAEGDVSMSWVRRARVGGLWRDGVDAPLGEAYESYDIEILDGLTVLRTIVSTTSFLIYTSAQQVEDFGSAQPSVDVRIYQFSEKVGRGIAVQSTL